MDQMIKKTIAKLEKHKHISGKDACLRFLLPLLRQMHTQYAQAFQTIDGNFDTVFESLGIGEQGFIDDAVSFIQSYNGFVDRLMAAAGFFEADPENEGSFRISSSMPPELQEELSNQQTRMVSFLQQLEALRLDEEDFDEEDEDEDEDFEEEVATAPQEEPSEDAVETSEELSQEEVLLSVEPDNAVSPTEVLPPENVLQGETHA